MEFDKMNEIAEDLLEDLMAYQDSCFLEEHAEDEAPFRVRTLDGETFSLHTGDASYDTDHRGHWGASSISADMCAADLIDELCEAIGQADDARYMDKENN